MTLKSYLLGMKISVVAACAAWVLVLWQIDPEKSAVLGQLLFYGSTLLFSAGIFILFFTWMRKIFSESDEVAALYVGISFREGILMAFLVIILLLFQQYRVLTWWDGALIVANIFLIELYFLTRK